MQQYQNFNLNNINLQNLAWLGADGQVHTVQQNNLNLDGFVGAAPPMLGAVNPMALNLQNLAWLGADGQVNTVNDGLRGSGKPMLGATAPML